MPPTSIEMRSVATLACCEPIDYPSVAAPSLAANAAAGDRRRARGALVSGFNRGQRATKLLRSGTSRLGTGRNGTERGGWGTEGSTLFSWLTRNRCWTRLLMHIGKSCPVITVQCLLCLHRAVVDGVRKVSPVPTLSLFQAGLNSRVAVPLSPRFVSKHQWPLP